MGKGLLAQWRRGILARGVAAAALLAVPVGVAAAIGFGTSLSGLAGGLSELASGPDAAPASVPADAGAGDLGPSVVSLAGAPGGGGGGGGAGGGGQGGTDGGGGGGVGGGATPGSGSGGGGGGGDGGQGGGGGSSGLPDVTLPGGPPVGGDPGGSVGEVIDGVDETVGGLLGEGQ